jgi:hypothetical protein
LDQTVIGNNNGFVTAGRIRYYFQNLTGTTYLDNITTSGGTLLTKDFPAILIMQEQDNSTNKDYVVIPTYARDTTNDYVGVKAPTCSDGTFSLVQWSGSNIYKYSDVTLFGTYVTRTVPANSGETVEVYYPDTQAVATVGVGASPTFAVGGAGTVQQAIKITQPIAKLASEVSSTAPASDLILVGGPCANAITAAVMAADNVTCGSGWPYTTGIIKEYTNAFTNGKKALVVAGTDADDTRSLAAMLIAGTYSYAT